MLTYTNNNELNAIREDLKRIEGKLDDLLKITRENLCAQTAELTEITNILKRHKIFQ